MSTYPNISTLDTEALASLPPTEQQDRLLLNVLQENRRLAKENSALRHCVLLSKEHGSLLAANIVATTVAWCDDKLRQFLTDVMADKKLPCPATSTAEKPTTFRPISPAMNSQSDSIAQTDILGSYIRQDTNRDPDGAVQLADCRRLPSPLYDTSVLTDFQASKRSRSPSLDQELSKSEPRPRPASDPVSDRSLQYQPAATSPRVSLTKKYDTSPYLPPSSTKSYQPYQSYPPTSSLPGFESKDPARRNESIPSAQQVSFVAGKSSSVPSWQRDTISSSNRVRSVSPKRSPPPQKNTSRSMSPGTGRTSRPSTPKALGDPILKSPRSRSRERTPSPVAPPNLTFEDLATSTRRSRSPSPPRYDPEQTNRSPRSTLRSSLGGTSFQRSRSRSKSPGPLVSFAEPKSSDGSGRSPLVKVYQYYQSKGGVVAGGGGGGASQSVNNTSSEGYGSQMSGAVRDAGYYYHVGQPVASSTPAKSSTNYVSPTSSVDTLAEIMGFSGTGAKERARAVINRPVDSLTGYTPVVTNEMKVYLQTARPSRRIVGEIAFQLDRRILEYVFVGDTRNKSLSEVKRRKPRYYGYSLTNILHMIQKESREDGIPNTSRELELRRRLDRVLRRLAPFGYILESHAETTQNMVNKYGLLNGPPDPKTVEGFGLDDPVILRILLTQIIRDEREVRNMLVILDCLCYLAHEDGRPIFMW